MHDKQWLVSCDFQRMEKRVADLDMSWMLDAACRGKQELFFDARKQHQAKRICVNCPVKEACLEYGMAQQPREQLHGIWGGLNPDEMRTLLRNRSRYA